MLLENFEMQNLFNDLKIYLKHLVCYQKDHTTTRSVSMHPYLSYDAPRGHWRPAIKYDIFVGHHEAYGTSRKVCML